MTEIALIGETANSEFAPLVRWLRKDYPSAFDSVSPSIESWERQQSSPTAPGLTVVLQSWSDEYRPAEVERLIGATLFSGLFCCYGEWCEGDGRTHAIWPHSTRVPARYARQVLRDELRRLGEGRPVIPPTAARDEVFLRRQSDQEFSRRGSLRALVVSPDRIYRTTLADVFRSRGWDADAVSPGPGSLQAVGSPKLIVHDLDPKTPWVDESLAACRARFPGVRQCGVASFPGSFSGPGERELPVVPRIDPLATVREIESLTFVRN